MAKWLIPGLIMMIGDAMIEEMDLENMSEGAKWFMNRPSIKALRKRGLENSVLWSFVNGA